MNRSQYEKEKEEFSSWAAKNHHNILSSFPRSGRNYISDVISQVTGRIVVQGINPREIHGVGFDDVLLYVAHLERWDIRGDRGRYILLIRDPRDAILSRMYHRVYELNSHEDVEELMRSEELILHNIRAWKDYFNVLLPLNPHVVQYEKHCLNPVDSIIEILDFLEAEPLDVSTPLHAREYVRNAIHARDVVKQDPTKTKEQVKVDFKSGSERYESHCLKWQRDPLVTPRFLDIIWTEASAFMERFGYTEDGHDIEMET